MLIPGQLLKRAARGELSLFPAEQTASEETPNPSIATNGEQSVLARERLLVAVAKKTALLILETASRKFGNVLPEQQEVLMSVADIIMDVYRMESAYLRAQKIAVISESKCQNAMTKVFCSDAMYRIETAAKVTIAAMSNDEGERREMGNKLKRYTQNDGAVNTVETRRQIADALIRANGYIF